MKKLFVGCVLMSVCLVSFAVPRSPQVSGVYVTGDFGYGLLYTPNYGVPRGYSLGNIAWSGGLGYGWALDDYTTLGIEADYLDNGRSVYNGDASNGELTVNANAVAMLFSLTEAWDSGFNLLLKAGPAYTQENSSLSSPAHINDVLYSGDHKFQKLTAMGVVGVGYYVLKKLNVFTDVTYVYGDSDWKGSPGGNVNPIFSYSGITSLQFKLGMSYTF